MRDFIASLDAQKLEVVREPLGEGSKIRAIWEARQLFDLSLRETVDLVLFLEKDEKMAIEGENE